MTYRFDAGEGVSRRALSTSVFAAVLAVGAVIAPSGPARAQVYFQPYVQSYYWRAPARPRAESFVSRREIAAILYDEDYRLAGPIDYRDDAIIAVGIDDQGRRMRFFLNPDDGEMIGARRLEPLQASRSGVYDEDPGFEPPRARPVDSRPRETFAQPPVSTPRRERSSEAAAPAGKAHQSAVLGAPETSVRPERPRAPAVAAIQRSSPRPTVPVTQDTARHAAVPRTPPASPAPAQASARPEGPPAPSASTVQQASSQPATPPIAQGSAHRAIVAPPGAAQATPAAPAAPVVGSTGPQAPSAQAPVAPAPGVAKPTGG